MERSEVQAMADRMTRKLRALGIDARASVISGDDGEPRIMVAEHSVDILQESFEHWELRAFLIAHDMDRSIFPLTTVESRMKLRRN